MTRKDFVALAEALVRSRPFDPDGIVLTSAYYVDQWRRDCQEIANTLATDNSRFDRERFVKACQGEKS